MPKETNRRMESPIPLTLLFAIIGTAGISAYFLLNKKYAKFAFACLVLGVLLILSALISWLAIILFHET